jgi:hypothetical protein
LGFGFVACQRNAGLHRAAFWRQLGYPNPVLARAAKARKPQQRQLKKWKREELLRTPFALLGKTPRGF